MNRLLAYTRSWHLFLIPIVATLGLGVNLIYSSFVSSDRDAMFREIRDRNFPVLEEADGNVSRYEATVVALNTAATTGESEFMEVAQNRAAEIRRSYKILGNLTPNNKNDIDKLSAEFDSYFSLASDITAAMMTKMNVPSFQKIAKMRAARNTYLADSIAYRDAAKKNFQGTVEVAIQKSHRMRIWLAVVGLLMLLTIIALTTLVKLDIIVRRKMEAALRENAEALRIAATTFETQDAILITDADANIIRVNRAFTDITGYSAAEVLGKNPRIMSSGRHDKNFYVEMWQQLLHKGSWSGEIWDKHKSGEIVPKWKTITAVKDEEQKTTHYVAISRDITERKLAEEEIRTMAFYDALTNLPNRRLFLERFQAALSASARRDDYGAVLFIDLDRFKSLNDTLGHDYGDLLLVEVGVRIQACIRETDTAARFGGDEFVVLLESTSLGREGAMQKVALVAEKIRSELSRPYQLKDHKHHSSPSIGVSLYHGHDDSRETVLEYADAAMYQAKKSGRNTVRFYAPDMQSI